MNIRKQFHEIESINKHRYVEVVPKTVRCSITTPFNIVDYVTENT